MADAKVNQQKALRELGEWMEKSIKNEIADTYKLAKELFGLRSVDALTLARRVVQGSLNKFMEANFYAGLPH